MLKPIESRSKPMQIRVQDAQSLDQFLANAKETWLEDHPQERKRWGRLSEMERVFESIWVVVPKGFLGKAPTQGKLFRVIHEQLGDQTLSERAIRKYAKMWLLLFRKPWIKWSDADRKWLAKYAPLIVKYQRLFLDTLLRYGQGAMYLNGVEMVIALRHLKIVIKCLKLLRHEMARFIPPKTVDGYTSPEMSFFLDALREYLPKQSVGRQPR